MTWTCPKCGRQFAHQDQQHYCGKPQNVDEYIDSFDEALQPTLREIRAIFQRALPEAEEKMSWSMPTYFKGRNIIHFAAFKKHLVVYPGGEATEVFAGELASYDCSKGTIRLPYDQPLPEELLTKIARWCLEQYQK